MESRPRLAPDLRPFYEAFWTLSAARQSGFGHQPLQLTELEAYIRLFDVQDRKRFVRLIQVLDKTWLTHQKEQADANPESRDRRKPSPSRS